MNSYVVNLYPVPNDGNPGETITVADDAVSSFTTTLNYKTTACYLSVTGGNVYVTFDGTTPSDTNGILLTAPYDRLWSKESTRVAKFIAVADASARVAMSQFTY